MRSYSLRGRLHYSSLFLILAEYCQEFLVLLLSKNTFWPKMLQNSAWRFSPISTILALVSGSKTNRMSTRFLSINNLLTLTSARKLINIFDFEKWERMQTWILCFSYSLQSVLGALPKPVQLESIYVTLILFCLYSTFCLHSWVFLPLLLRALCWTHSNHHLLKTSDKIWF